MENEQLKRENNQLKKQLDELQQEASKLKEDLDCVAKTSVQIAAESQVHYEFAQQAKATSKSMEQAEKLVHDEEAAKMRGEVKELKKQKDAIRRLQARIDQETEEIRKCMAAHGGKLTSSQVFIRPV